MREGERKLYAIQENLEPFLLLFVSVKFVCHSAIDNDAQRGLWSAAKSSGHTPGHIRRICQGSLDNSAGDTYYRLPYLNLILLHAMFEVIFQLLCGLRDTVVYACAGTHVSHFWVTSAKCLNCINFCNLATCYMV